MRGCGRLRERENEQEIIYIILSVMLKTLQLTLLKNMLNNIFPIANERYIFNLKMPLYFEAH